ncbi:DUF6011 domain-containing protein [Glycomyces sp. NPDC021274]|uniref:DUF6011 domain-containing protein n=1 Tax=Glycomyces sp. NPDC021274 TaxID=3155120 RepID=UPI0033F45F8B
MSTQPPLADGYYAVLDPDDDTTMTCWRVKGGRVKAHPAKARYGPVLPRRKDAPGPPGSDEFTVWFDEIAERLNDWYARLHAAIEASPLAAQVEFAKATGHCCNCGRALKDGASRVLGIGPDCRERIPHPVLMAYLAEVRKTQTADQESC